MGKKQRRRSAPVGGEPTAPPDESQMVLNEEDFMRDEIDEHLLDRDEIRYLNVKWGGFEI